MSTHLLSEMTRRAETLQMLEAHPNSLQSSLDEPEILDSVNLFSPSHVAPDAHRNNAHRDAAHTNNGSACKRALREIQGGCAVLSRSTRDSARVVNMRVAHLHAQDCARETFAARRRTVRNGRTRLRTTSFRRICTDTELNGATELP